MSKELNIYIPVGYVASFTTDALTSGTYVRLPNPGGTSNTPTAFVASTAYTIGPFNDPYDYRFNYEGNTPSVAISNSGIYTAADDTALGLKADKASPTFTGTVVLPSTTSIGTVSNTEIGYIDGVTSSVQTQLNAKAATTYVDAADALKAPLASPTFTGTVALPVVTVAKADGTEASNAVTASGAAGVITTSALSTAAGATYVITWTNTAIAATSVIQLTHMGGTNTKDVTFKVVPGSGTATLTINNVDLLAALDGTVIIGYLVL